MIVWDDGALRPAQDVRISPHDRGFLIGDGAFETFRVLGGGGVRLHAHAERLFATLCGLEITVAWSADDLAQAVAELSRANNQLDGVARLTVSAGEGGRGLDRPAPAQGRAVMTLSPTPAPRPPLCLRVDPSILRPRGNPANAMKTLASYADARFALRRARYAGADDAILLDDAGCVACATTSNVFWIAEGRVLTPALTGAVLPGVTRGAVFAAAAAAGVACAPVEAGADAMFSADAVFLANAARGVMSAATLVAENRPATPIDPDHPLLVEIARGVRASELDGRGLSWRTMD